jgi:hypothetical protein
MKLSPRTVQILKNFSHINPSLKFDEGSVIKTISPNKTMMAKANLDNVIPQTFSIYDLSRFLGVLSLFEDPSFEFEETGLTIRSDGRTVGYTYASESTIITPPDREIVMEADVSFKLPQDQFVEVMKALGVMSLPDFVVAGQGGKIWLRATDTKNPSADKYDIEIGDNTAMDGFEAIFKTENLKIIPADYDVTISAKGLAHFKSDDIEYWISLDSNSSF